MFSIPPATTMFLSPFLICEAPIISAFIPLAQTLLTAVVGVSTLHPAPKIACLSGACPRDAYKTLPMNPSSISSGESPECSMAPLMA
jgi:hypothetical protein